MRIVVMDDVTLSEEQMLILRSVGELAFNTGTPRSREEILSRAKDAEILISGWTHYPEGIFEELPKLQMIALWATGTDYVNLKEAKQAGITVTNVPGYSRNAVAELAFGLMLSVLRKIPQSQQDVKNTRSYNWQLFEGNELAGKTLGILGTGAIGAKVARIARGFEMKVIGYDVYQSQELENEGLLRYVGFDEIFTQSDIVTVHMPLLADTNGIIALPEFEKMPRHAILINTARAGLIDQGALTMCLKNGLLAGAGLDDLDLDHQTSRELLAMDNVVVTSHIGFYTAEAIQVKSSRCVHNVIDFVKNRSAVISL
jgi:phosphoglycerate dehydrogenase-like enzyme